MEKEKAPPVVGDEGTFESLERDFQEVLSELTGDKSLEKFRDEYEKLHRALKKSHDNEKRLMTKCRELNAEIVANSAKVSTALKLSQEDQASIASLKKVSNFLNIKTPPQCTLIVLSASCHEPKKLFGSLTEQCFNGRKWATEFDTIELLLGSLQVT